MVQLIAINSNVIFHSMLLIVSWKNDKRRFFSTIISRIIWGVYLFSYWYWIYVLCVFLFALNEYSEWIASSKNLKETFFFLFYLKKSADKYAWHTLFYMYIWCSLISLLFSSLSLFLISTFTYAGVYAVYLIPTAKYSHTKSIGHWIVHFFYAPPSRYYNELLLRFKENAGRKIE